MKPFEKPRHLLEMEQNNENHYSSFKNENRKMLKKKTDNAIKSNKCNQCDYASSHKSNLRIHLMTHSGEKLNKWGLSYYTPWGPPPSPPKI